MRRKPLIIAGIVLAVLILAVLALPFLVDVNRFRPAIEGQMQSALGRPVKIGTLHLALLAGGIRVEEVSIGEDPAFGATPFVQAKSLEVGVEMLPLIFSQSLRVRSMTLEEPQVSLLQTPAGKWNFSSLGSADAKVRKTSGAPADFEVGVLRVVSGRVRVGTTGARGQQQLYENVNVEARNIGFRSRMPFTADATTPGGGTLKVEGNAGPLNRDDAAQTPFEADVTVSKLDLANTGVLPPGSGIAGTVDYSGKVKSDGAIITSQGKLTAEKLRLVRGGAPAKQPVGLEYKTEYDVAKKAGSLNDGKIRIGSSTANLNGRFDTRSVTPVAHMKFVATNLPVQEIQGVLPAFGVVLPAGASLQGGTVNANLSIDGPLDRLVTTGPVNIANTKLAGFNLGSKMSAMSALAGVKTGADTVIETMSSQLRVGPEGIRADNLKVVVPSVGTVTGAGTISSGNALNFKMQAKLAGGGGLAGGMSALSTLGQSKGAIPFLVQGTTSNPVFLPDVAGAMGNTAKAPVQGVGGLMGLFGKKKTN
jgi:AsmA protein